MNTTLPFTIPYLIDFTRPAVDDAVSFIVSSLLALMIHAEGQAFMATVLGDYRNDDGKRLHFNAFLHLDILGTLSFFVGGFGWPRNVAVDFSKADHPRLYAVLARFGGIIGNFLLASIAGSIVWVLSKYDSPDRVFTMVVAVNVTMAVFHLIPIPPLAGASLVTSFLSEDSFFFKIYTKSGPYLIIAVFLAERLTGIRFISRFLDPLVVYLYYFIVGT